MKTPNKIPIKKPKPKIKKVNPKALAKSAFKAYSTIVIYTLFFMLLFFALIYVFGGDDYSLSTFIWFQVFILALGVVHVLVGKYFFEWARPLEAFKSILFTTILSGFGVGLVFLSRYWNQIPTLPLTYANGLVLFMVPHVFGMALDRMRDIPSKIFEPWIYPYKKEIPIVEVINPIKVRFYVAKQRADDEFTEFVLNVPNDYKIGDFMHYFIHRYNYDKNPDSPIYISPDNSVDHLYHWLFRRKPGSLNNSDILDPKESFKAQNINENDVIVVERYDYQVAQKAAEVIENEVVVEEQEGEIFNNESEKTNSDE